MRVIGMIGIAFLFGSVAGFGLASRSKVESGGRGSAMLIEGIGGIFLRAQQPDSLRDWYRRAFDLPIRVRGTPAGTSFEFQWGRLGGPGIGRTVWSVFGPESEYMGSIDRQCMVNYRVRDLDALGRRLDSVGIPFVGGPDAYENGRFAWLLDPAGNRVELWEPLDTSSVR